MSVDHDYVNRVAKKMMNFLNDRKVENISNLENLIDKKIPMNDSENEFVLIEMRPSFGNQLAYTISYYSPFGIPLEIKINEGFENSKLIVKSNYKINGYKFFCNDPLGNLVQFKELKSTNLKMLKEELAKLYS